MTEKIYAVCDACNRRRLIGRDVIVQWMWEAFKLAHRGHKVRIERVGE